MNTLYVLDGIQEYTQDIADSGILQTLGKVLGGLLIAFLVLYLASKILKAIGYYMVFNKMGIDGWKAFIPYYSEYCKFDKMNSMTLFYVWLLCAVLPISSGIPFIGKFIAIILAFIAAIPVIGQIFTFALVLMPFAAFILDAIVQIEIADAFGCGVVFKVLYILFEPIMTIILGLGNYTFKQYRPKSKSITNTPADKDPDRVWDDFD